MELFTRYKNLFRIVKDGEEMRENKMETISNLFEGSEIRSIWDSEKED